MNFVKLTVLTMLSAVFLCGCSSKVSLTAIGADGRKSYEDSFVFNGGLSAGTVNILGNNLLRQVMEDDPEQFIGELENLCRREPDPCNFIAVAETSQMIAASLRDDPDAAVKFDLTTLIYTNKYFQTVIKQHSSLLFDPEAIIAVKCYNLAVTELFSYLRNSDLHTAGTFELPAAGGQVMAFEIPDFKLPVAKDKIVSFLLCSDFRPENLTHDSRSFGIGVPLICELSENAVPETVFAEGQVIPATLAVRISPDTDENRKKVQLFYLDSRSIDRVELEDVVIPLAQDFSTPLAYMVKNPRPFNFIERTFQIELTQKDVGLYHLEPHNDNRIPIVLVHGLMSDIRTWLQLINTLQSDPELRKHYRFMGFSYSSGNPIFISAMQLRQALKLEREKLQKDGRNLEKFDRMVLIGHSMGGLLSRMMISTSNDELLCNFVGKDIYETAIDHQDEEFRKIMIFEPLPPVKRVIFIAVPHRGSELAQSIVGKTAAYFIKIPKSLIDFNTKLFKKLVNMPSAKKTDVGQFNGIDNLSPDGTALKLLNAMPISPDVPYHSIIGNRRRQNTPGGSDGIVSYSSSHLDGAVSEIVVQSGHSVQQNPLAIQEIKRILKEHLKSDGKK